MANDNFAAAMNRFNEKARLELTRRVRRVGLESLRRIVIKTPVDTGTARANWNVYFGVYQTEFDPNKQDKSGGATISSAGMKAMSATAGVDLFISNSCPYIGKLEYGYSRQRPEGMVRTTAQEIHTLIQRGAL